MDDLQWMLKEPGPLLFIEKELFKKWQGAEGSSGGKDSDHLRASALRKYISPLAVDSRECLVFTRGRIVQAAWLDEDPTGGILVTSDDKIIPTDEILRGILAQAGPDDWKDTKVKFTVDELELLIVSSVENFPDLVFGSLEVALDRGMYAVKSAHYEDESWCLDFYRFIPKKVEAGFAKAKRLELQRNRQKKIETHLEKILEILISRDPNRIINEKALFHSSPEWTDSMIREGVEFFCQTQDSDAKDFLLNVLQGQALTQTQRTQLSEYSIQSWQRNMAQGKAVSPIAKSYDELVNWMIDHGEFVNGRSDAIISAVKEYSLKVPTVLRIFSVPPEQFLPFYAPRMLTLQIESHKQIEDLRLLYRIFLGLESAPSVDGRTYSQFFEIFLRLKAHAELPLLILDPERFSSYFASLTEGISAIVRQISNPDNIPSTDACIWWTEFLMSRTPQFARALGDLPGPKKELLSAMTVFSQNRFLQRKNTQGEALMREISSAMEEWSS